MTTVKVDSATPGWKLDVEQHLPSEKAAPYPVIIMGHGLALEKRFAFAPYISAFTAAGYACLPFDYRHFGASDGIPRHILDGAGGKQAEDYHSVIKYARQNPQLFDSNKIVVWGTSYGGGNITVVAAEDPSLAAAVGQCPFMDGMASALALPYLNTLKLVPLSIYDFVRGLLGLEPYYIRAAGGANEIAMIATWDAKWGYGMVTTGSSSATVPSQSFPNQVAARAFLPIPLISPLRVAHTIKMPFLLCIAKTDTMCPAAPAIKATKLAAKGEAYVYDGGHFDCYPEGKCHKEVLQKQLDFLKSVL